MQTLLLLSLLILIIWSTVPPPPSTYPLLVSPALSHMSASLQLLLCRSLLLLLLFSLLTLIIWVADFPPIIFTDIYFQCLCQCQLCKLQCYCQCQWFLWEPPHSLWNQDVYCVVRQRSNETKGANYGFRLWFYVIQGSTKGGSFKQDSSSC